jgi:hypothetical protein
MDKNERNVLRLNWDANGSGKFEAVVMNGELKHFEGYSSDGSLDLYSNNLKFLLAVRDSINELETEVKGQAARYNRNINANGTAMPSKNGAAVASGSGTT